MIGIQGPHGSGKTTLATSFADAFDYPFAKTTTSAVFKDLGINPSHNLDFDTRMMVQEAILTDTLAVYQAARGAHRLGVFVTDRTPIDMLAYTLSGVGQEPLSARQYERLQLYTAKCFAALNELFAVVFSLQPGIPVAQNREGKAASSPAYIEHIDRLVKGLSVSEEVSIHHFLMPKSVTDLKGRVACMANAISLSTTRLREGDGGYDGLGSPIALH